jgi:uncharacterized iron-regulated protein
MGGCAGTKMPTMPLATIPGVSGHFGIGRIVDLRSGKTLSFEEMIERVATRDLVFVGEVHDNPEHHLIQLQILQAFIDRSGSLTIAMEFFQKPNQGAVDRYIQGELTESEFLKTVDWSEAWGHDYHFYRPLMLAAKQKGIRVLAINAPGTIVKKVAREGLSSLSADERGQVAEEIDLGNRAHREFLRKAYEVHAHKDLQRFEYFYEAQCVWEESMAENLSSHLKEKGGRLVVFAGNGHIIHKFGIPDRTLRRFPLSMATIVPFPLNEKEVIDSDTADYLWLTADYPHRFRFFHEQGKDRPST